MIAVPIPPPCPSITQIRFINKSLTDVSGLLMAYLAYVSHCCAAFSGFKTGDAIGFAAALNRPALQDLFPALTTGQVDTRRFSWPLNRFDRLHDEKLFGGHLEKVFHAAVDTWDWGRW